VTAPGLSAALSPALAARFARIALDNIGREYPHKLDHVLEGAGDVRPPRALHPSFHGSYDWHSCVHMHWLLALLYRRFPQLPLRPAIAATFDRNLAPAAIAAEVAYLATPHNAAFVRTYGWAWLLQLALELAEGAADDADIARWSTALAPLARAFTARWLDFLPRTHHPIRHGVHANSAFGLALALDFARCAGVAEFERALVAKALAWYAADRDAPAAWEPSGADFLSPVLVEADLMRRVLDAPAFSRWLDDFLPGLARGEPATLFTPVPVSDRGDPQIVHLDGLNLSRAWSFAGIARALPVGDARAPVLASAFGRHLDAGMSGLDSDDFLGAHWLASFAALALIAAA
jgi:Protein of unknown function (DUF2891)